MMCVLSHLNKDYLLTYLGYNKSLISQPGHPSVGRRNEYRSKGGDALRLGVKADMVLFAGNTV